MKKATLFLAAAASLVVAQATAADIAKAPMRVNYGTANVCNQNDCSGFIVGVSLSGISTNPNVIGNGINGSIAAGGEYFGVHAGYQYWDGKFYLSPEAFLDYGFGNQPIVGGQAPVKLTYGAYVDVGAPFASIFGGVQPTNTTGIPALLLSQTLAPFVRIGGEGGPGDSASITGAGVAFWVNQNWIAKAGYEYEAWISHPPSNKVFVEVSYKF